MVTRPKKRTEQAPASSNALLDALRFCSLITRDIGPINETHICLGAHWACASNGTIACGHPIIEDIYACPQSKLIIEALSKCNGSISFTQLDAAKLSIKSNKFKAVVPCIDPTLLNLAVPDPPVAAIDDRFKDGLAIVGVLAAENAQQIHLASILMNGETLVSTTGKMIFEYWHGINLPSDISLPKAIVDPITKTNKKLVKFGYSEHSVTIYFEDESWIKSQLYVERWPDIATILNRSSNPWPVPGDFWTALDAIAPFTESGFVYFDAGMLRSHDNAAQGACYEIAGLPKGLAFPAKSLALIRPYAQRIDFLAKDCLMFYGERLRGAIAGVRRA
jgi:hypothetical protein